MIVKNSALVVPFLGAFRRCDTTCARHSFHLVCGIATGSEVHTAQRREKKGGLSSQIARNSLSREITTIIEELLFL